MRKSKAALRAALSAVADASRSETVA